ncbi:MAG: hypothetical protein R2819_11090 [Allomuricauda sp.]
MYSFTGKKLRVIIALLLFGWTFSGAHGQARDLSGEWLMQLGLGTKNEARIEQTGDQLVLWMQFNGQLWTFSGKVNGDSIEVSRPLDNTWEKQEEKECHEQIMGQLEQYPQYAMVMKLKVEGKKIKGSLVLPSRISCENGIFISLADPMSVELTPINYLYWASGKKILKAPTNHLEMKDTLAEGNLPIRDLIVDRMGERVYWAEGKHIFSVNQTGKSKLTITTAEEEVFSPHSLVIDNKQKKLLWVEGYKIMSTPLKNDLRTVVLEEQNSPRSLAIDSINQKLYWVVEHSDKIRRSNMDGSNAEDFKDNNEASYLAIDARGGYLYYTTYLGIFRIPLSGSRTVENVFSNLHDPRSIFFDDSFDRIYWVESHGLTRTVRMSGVKLPRKQDFMETYDIYNLALGPKGPSSYEEVKIKGSMLIKEAVAGKSMLQELVRDDVYYQVLLSEYAKGESEFNLTDARLLLIWGENFPQRRYRGNNIVFTSSDPKITYQEYDTWNYRLDDEQKKKYVDHPLWLEKNSGLKTTTWDAAWKKVKDSVGQTQLDSIKKMDHMLVLATPKEGVLPGLKSFTMNDAQAQWFMNVGNTNATMRFLRVLPNGEEETISNIYAGDPFYIEVTTSQNIGENELELSFFVDNKPLQAGSVQLLAKKHGNSGHVFRTRPMSLQEFSENGGQLQMGLQGNVESVCKIGSVFKASVSNTTLFNNGLAPNAAAPLVNPLSTIWHKALGEAVVLSNLTIPEEDWERSITKQVETFTNMDIRAIPNGGITTSCSVTLGDYAAMILLRRYFVKQMENYYQSLDKYRDDVVFQYGFWEMMTPQMANEGFPLGNIEVTDDDVALRNAFSKTYILENFNSPEAASQWIKAAKKDGFVKYVNSVKKSLETAKDIKDTEIKKLLDLTGFGFKAMIDMVTSDLQMKKYPTDTEYACEVVPHIWEPDNVGRSSVKTMNNTAEHCRANEEWQTAQFDFALTMAGAITAGTGYLLTSAKLATAVIGAALGSGELVRDNFKFSAEDEEVSFSEGTYGVLGVERYAMAKLKVTPTWSRMLSYFGGGLGVAGDAFDILKFVGKVDMASAYARLPALLGEVDTKGALDAYQAMSSTNKARFLLLLGEAEELKKLPLDQLTDTQKRLLSAAEQFASELDVAAKAKNAANAVGDVAADLSEGLPAGLKKEVPIIKDDALPGTTVRLEYELDANGFLSNIKIRAGKAATAQHIAEHVPALSRMKEYEAVAGRAGNLYRKIRYWYRRAFKGEPPLGSPAWESMQEVKKLNQIIESRINGLIDGIDDLNPRSFSDEINELTEQLNKHQKAFEEFVTNPALGRGFVAATNDPAKKFRGEIDNYIKNLRTPKRNLPTASSKRMTDAKNLLEGTDAGKQLYNAVVEQAAKQGGDVVMVGQFLERLSYLSDLTPTQLLTMRKFIDATGNVESMTLMLRRGTPAGREFIKTHYRDLLNKVLQVMEQSSGNTEALNGIATYLTKIRRGSVDAVDDLFLLSRNFDPDTFADVLGTIHKFADVEGFPKLLSNLGSFGSANFTGAMGHLHALNTLAKKYDPSQFILEQRIFGGLWGDNFRNIDIVVIQKRADDFDILEIVEVKEYSNLEGLFDFKIKRQFAKDVLIAHVNGFSLKDGVRWMVNKHVLDAGATAAQKLKLKQEFLKAFDNETLKKEIFCHIGKDVGRYRKELEDSFDEIFQFF